MSAVVAARALSKRFGAVTALEGIGFELRENTINGLLGRNGAGKTTLMRVLTGRLLPTTGSVEVFGRPPFEDDTVLPRICLISENHPYPATYRAQHVIEAARLVHPAWDESYAQRLIADFRLPLRRYVRALSRGQQSALGIIVGLAARAPLTFFDEPYLGLDATARQTFYDRLLEDYTENPRTVVLSTHLIDEVADLLEHVLVLESGRLLLDESADALRDRAVTVVGPTAAVDAFTAGRLSLRRERLAATTRATVLAAPGADRARARELGLDVEPVSLQQLVIRMTSGPTVAGSSEPVAVPEGAPR
jgi:ABC-2 type transport system ATP-binding protein